MSLPVSEPLFPEEPPETPSSQRRRKRRRSAPLISGDQADLVKELFHEVTPSIDFMLYSILGGLILGLAALADSPSLFFLAAVSLPFLAPVIGLSLASALGSGMFYLREATSTLISSALVFLCGMGAGWLAGVFPVETSLQTGLYARFSWSGFAVTTLAAVLVNLFLVRGSRPASRLASAVLAYQLYLPVGVAGFGLVSGIQGLFPDGLVVYLVYLAWTSLVGTFTLAILGLRPGKGLGYTLGSSVLLAVLAAVVVIGGFGTAISTRLGLPMASLPTPVQVTPLPSRTQTRAVTNTFPPKKTSTLVEATQPAQGTSPVEASPILTPTNTLIPSRTPTITLTKAPTPVYARIRANDSDGAFIRSEPNYTSKVLAGLMNGAIVEVLPETTIVGGTTWVRVRSADGNTEGWMVRSLTVTATPGPP